MTREARLSAFLLATGSAVMLLAATICTWAVAHGASLSWRLLFRPFCHGIVSRCFEIWGAPMPICARCTGIYVGLLAGLTVFVLAGRSGRLAFPTGLLLLCISPLALDGMSQAVRLRESTNELRLWTGLGAGIAFALWALVMVDRNGRRVAQDSKFETVTMRQ
ncbi:MAG: DUF2085 domain-containing protein [Acidobacteriota bacterium]